jgi:hypothetical protein
MKYTVGQQIWIIGFVLTNLQTKQKELDIFFNRPKPDYYDIEQILFRQITVTEVISPDGLHPAYIALDEFGNKFTCDKTYMEYSPYESGLEWVLDDWDKKLIEDPKHDADAFHVETLARGLTFSYMYLPKFLSEISGVLVLASGKTKAQESPEWPRLQAIIDRVVTEFKQVTGKNVVSHIEERKTSTSSIKCLVWEIVESSDVVEQS